MGPLIAFVIGAAAGLGMIGLGYIAGRLDAKGEQLEQRLKKHRATSK